MAAVRKVSDPGATQEARRATEEAPGPETLASASDSDSEVVARARRRQFSNADKRRILEAAARAHPGPGCECGLSCPGCAARHACPAAGRPASHAFIGPLPGPDHRWPWAPWKTRCSWTLNSEPFATAPAAVHATVLDEGHYLRSMRTMLDQPGGVSPPLRHPGHLQPPCRGQVDRRARERGSR